MSTRPHVAGRPVGRLATRGLLTLTIGISVLLGASTGRATAAVRAVPHSCADAPGHVSLVVDFGSVASVAGAPDGVVTACVALADRDTGLDVLKRAFQKPNLTAPRLSPAGMVCGINGYPLDGCGAPSASNFLYWSYWHGDAGGWTYATTGAGGYRPQSGGVEGWRFIDGKDSSDGVGLTPPRNLAGIGPSYLASNISGPIPTVTPPPDQRPPEAGGGHDTVGPGAVPNQDGSTPPSRAPSTTLVPSATSDDGGHPTATSSTTTPAGATSSTNKAPRITSVEEAPAIDRAQLQRVTAHQQDTTPTGSLVGAVIGIVAIVALVAFGLVRAGRRGIS